MSVAIGAVDRRTGAGVGGGRGAARRAVVRWAWRLFRREWRQQLLVLALLTVAVAATTAGVALATTATPAAETTFTLPGSDPQLAADVAAMRQTLGSVEVFAHQRVAVPGSVATVDLRAQDVTVGQAGAKSRRLLAGRYPTGASEVAVTHGVATTFDLRVGGTWNEGGRALRVVGLVENPLHLQEDFGLLAPGQADPPATVTVRLAAEWRDRQSLHLPGGRSLSIQATDGARNAAAAAVLALATICLLFVGLVAVAGFTVMAQRRQRALGMLGAVGAADGHVRLVMVANGAVVGLVAALTGGAVGVLGWLASAPRLETLADHRIDRFDLPWWAIGAAAALAVLTAVAAAWWPARSASRLPIVAALSGRPPRPQPAHRFAALGGLLLAGGLILLALVHQKSSGSTLRSDPNPLLIIAGTVATTIGALFFAPLAIRTLARVGARSPIAVRLALRNLARYQARSGAALGAITLVVGIAATIAVSARSAEATSAAAAAGGNLPANEVAVYLSAHGPGGPSPAALSPAELQTAQARVGDIATSLHTTDVVALEAAQSPTALDRPSANRAQPSANGDGGPPPAALARVQPVAGGMSMQVVTPLYVASPAVLAHYGINAGDVDPAADVLSSEPDLAGLQIVAGRAGLEHPKIQTVALPRYTSDPNSLITTHAIETLGLDVLPAGWIIRSGQPLTTAQIDSARRLAATAGLTIETRSAG
ncbi:MAG TPA: FtsX-like permease family protein, partial [Acidimicrobiia bacterium]|nr:FtsX-like permease family protein [Acidimicrobiia bacterium]